MAINKNDTNTDEAYDYKKIFAEKAKQEKKAGGKIFTVRFKTPEALEAFHQRHGIA